jgi:hypothetical protein
MKNGKNPPERASPELTTGESSLDDAACSRFFRDRDGDLGEQIEVDHLTNPMGEIWRRLKYRNGKTSWMPDRLLTEIHTYNKDA